MKTTQKFYLTLVGLALGTGLLLSIPLIAMQFSREVSWTLSDFVLAGALIFFTGLAYLLISRKSARTVYRIAAAVMLFTSLFLIWANGAVGLVGAEDNSFNLLYFFVILVGIAGAFMARFRAKGMGIVLFAMAATQGIIAIAALLTGMAKIPESSVAEILIVNAFFIILFVISAWLFRIAAHERPDAGKAELKNQN